MKARTGLCVSLCGSLLLGCSSFPSLSSLLGDRGSPPVLRVAKDADAEYRRGKRLHLEGEYGEAQKAYLSALAINPDHAEAKNAIAALIGAHGDLDRAIIMLVDLSTHYPASHVYANLGHAYQLKGRDFDARDAYQRAVDIDPGNDAARKRLMALDQQLNATAIVGTVVDETPLAEPLDAQNSIQSIGPSMYAMRYPMVSASMPSAGSLPKPESPMTSDSPTAVSVSQPAGVLSTKHPIALQIELVNANGVTGLARELRALLPNDQWRVVRTRNHKHFSVSATRIEYIPAHRSDALDFAQNLGIAARLRANSDLQGPRLRIILGQDFRNLEQLKQKLTSERQLAALSFGDL